MSLSIRDVAIPPDEVPSLVKAFQIGLYLALIPTSIIIYDTRASNVSDHAVLSSDGMPVCTLDKEVRLQMSALRLYDDNTRLTGQVLLGK